MSKSVGPLAGFFRAGVRNIPAGRWLTTAKKTSDLVKKKLEELSQEELELIQSDVFVPDEDDPLSDAWSEIRWKHVKETYPPSYHKKERD